MMSYIFKGFELIGFNETKMNAYSILLFYPYTKNRKMRFYFSTVCNSLTMHAPILFVFHIILLQIYLVFFPFQKHIQVDSYLVTLNTLSSLRALRVLMPNDAPSL